MTEAEKKFWQRVRAHRAAGLGFRRQVPVAGYIADFVCHERKLIVEIDGATHSSPAEISHDKARTAKLVKEGYRVLRFWNDDVLRNPSDVIDQVVRAAEEADDG